MNKTNRVRYIIWLIIIIGLFSALFTAVTHHLACRISYRYELEYSEKASGYIENFINLDRGASDIESIEDIPYFFDPFAIIDNENGEFVYGLSQTGQVADPAEAEDPGSLLYHAQDFLSVGDYFAKINGTNYSIHTASIKDGRYSLVQFTQKNYWFAPAAVLSIIVTFICMAIIVSLYVIYIRAEDREKPVRSIVLTVLTCTLAGTLIASYTARLEAIDCSYNTIEGARNLFEETFENKMSENALNRNRTEEKWMNTTRELLEKLETAEPDDFLSGGDRYLYRTTDSNGDALPIKNSSGENTVCIANSALLKSLAGDFGFRYLKIYDSNGRCIVSSNDEWSDHITEGGMRDVLDRVSKSYSAIEEHNGKYYVVSALPLTIPGGDDEFGDYGLLKTAARCPSYVLTDEAVFSETAQLMSMISTADIVCTDDDEQHTILYASQEFGQVDAAALGLSDESCFEGNYLGACDVNGEKFLVINNRDTLETTNGEKTIYVACYVKSEGKLLSVYLPYIAWKLAPVALLLLAALAWLIMKVSPKFTTGLLIEKVQIGDYSTDAELGAFNTLRAEDKIKLVSKMLLLIITALVFLYSVYTIAAGVTGTLSYHVWYYAWSKGLNIIAISNALAIALYFYLFISLGKLMFMGISQTLSAESKTLFRLIISIFSYSATIFCIFYSLWLMGMNIKAVLTSLGAFSLLIGLGAQTLIKDIIAGFFIIVENQFRVGDEVTIGDFSGTVKEIGLRACKLEKDGNIECISNSSITKVVNKTKLLSHVKMKLYINSDVDPKVARGVFEAALPEITAQHSNLYSLKYVGVLGLEEADQYAYSVQFIAYVEERDTKKVIPKLYEDLVKVANDNNLLPEPKKLV